MQESEKSSVETTKTSVARLERADTDRSWHGKAYCWCSQRCCYGIIVLYLIQQCKQICTVDREEQWSSKGKKQELEKRIPTPIRCVVICPGENMHVLRTQDSIDYESRWLNPPQMLCTTCRMEGITCPDKVEDENELSPIPERSVDMCFVSRRIIGEMTNVFGNWSLSKTCMPTSILLTGWNSRKKLMPSKKVTYLGQTKIKNQKCKKSKKRN